METKPSRREFCATAVSFVTLASLIESCGGSPTSSSTGSNFPALPIVNGTAAAGNTVTVNIDGASALNTVGNAALVHSGNNSILVARTSQDGFTAVTAICTHQGCEITRYQSGTYGCPCHGSEFSTSGAVQQGPANSSLRQFGTSFANNVLTITL